MYIWQNQLTISPKRFRCGYCGADVGPNIGFSVASGGDGVGLPRLMICSLCAKPTFFDLNGKQTPGVAYGDEVQHLPPEIAAMYTEARACMSINAYTSAVLACRKLLMNVAVREGAPEGKRFIDYVDYLVSTGYVPPTGKTWVDHIRQKGNEATHEIPSIADTDAKTLVDFTEMLLKLIYEFPNRVPAKSTP